MLGEPKFTTPTREIKLTRLSPDACIDVVGTWLSRTNYPLIARDAYASNRRWNLEDEISGAVTEGPNTALRVFKTEEESVVAFLTQPWKSRGEVPLALQLEGFSNEIPPFKEALVEGFIAETNEADQTPIIGVEYHPLEIKRNSNPDTIVGDIVERV
jgi:hypothetical protein